MTLTLCAVSGVMHDSAGAVLASKTFKMVRTGTVASTGTSPDKVATAPYVQTVTTDGSGNVSFNAYPGSYQAVMARDQAPALIFEMAVPDAATADIADIIDSVSAMTPTLLQEAVAARDTAVAAAASVTYAALSVSGTANAVALTTGLSLSSVPTGYKFSFRAASANTAATTISFDGLTAVTAKTITGAALPAGYIRTDVDTFGFFDGTDVILDRAPERGSNANGDYVKTADGRLWCAIGPLDLAYSNASTCQSDWTFPWAFSVVPVVTGPVDMGGSLSRMTPALDEIGAVSWTNSGSNNTVAKLAVRRFSGGADFVSGDVVRIKAEANGFWY